MGLNYYSIKKHILKARKLVIRGTTAAGSGHPGGSFSMAEILGCIFTNHLKFDPKNPNWEDRDKLILSKGHASPGLFSNMAIAKYFEPSELDTLRQFGSKLQGHPDLKCPGVEFCGGSLGIGLSFSIGCALAAKLDGKDQHIYTIMGDGESDEGQVWEAAMTASKYKVDNLTLILDRNFLQQDSYTEKIMPLDTELLDMRLSTMRDPEKWKTGMKWRSFGWNVLEVDGHKTEQLNRAILQARSTKNVPTIIIARTIKGKEIEHMEHNPKWHGKAPAPDIAPIINLELDSQFMIAPSIIAGDMSNLEREVERCVEGNADYIHLDVMDGVFVPNKTFDHDIISKLRPITDTPFDVHLMINDPLKHVKDYVSAGSDIITVHAEVCDASSFGEIFDYLTQHQISAGLAINPDTELPLWAIPFISKLDQLIVMSVVPGKSGQSFIESTHMKTQNLMKQLQENNFAGYVEIDGGVNLDNIGMCFDDGSRIFVGGSAIVGQSDVSKTIRKFRDAVLIARRRNLLNYAKKLGGDTLVEKWINLHEIGAKQDQLRTILEDMA